MKKIRLLIVDDEKSARDELATLLSKHPTFEIAGTAANGEEALEAIDAKAPIDALFLDIDMPGMNGLDLAGVLSTWPHPPRVVFATAHNQYAVAAFEANAVDYILKPYREDRIMKALDKIREAVHKGPADSTLLVGLGKSLFEKGLVKKIVVHKKNSRDRIVVDPANCDYFHAESAEVFARAGSQDYIVNMTLKELTSSLTIQGFAACHKAYLINLAKIEKISPLFNGNFEILLKTGAKIPLSRRFAKEIRSKIGGW